MSATGPLDFNFDSAFEAAAYAKWFLRLPLDSLEDEFSPEEWQKFLTRRELRLNAELDDLLSVQFNSPHVCQIEKKSMYKIAKAVHRKPLNADGSLIKSSRFNYKVIPQMQNRVVYLGQDKQCCFGELFHLDIQKYNYSSLIERTPEDAAAEFKFPDYRIYEYEVDLDNVLVLTTESTYKALGIPDRVVKNEWYSLNDDLEIPTSGQILGTMVRNRGFKGILYTSVRTQTSSNLVIFEENTGPLNFPLLNETAFDPARFFK
ncbi:RES family NAD+ phosphorylase [Bdellovibrionota bacterium FG-2]